MRPYIDFTGGLVSKPKVTLADVAAQTGFSLATVSMILAGRTDMGFASQTVELVRSTAANMGYVSTRRDTSFGAGQILVISPNISNPYYSTIIQAIQQGASEIGLGTIVRTTYRDMEEEEAILKEIGRSSLAGAIFTMQPQCGKLVERINLLKPIVTIGDRTSNLNVDTVELNNFEAGLLLGRHMTGLGHRNAAYISTPLNEANSARIRRLEGVQAAFLEAGGTVAIKTMDVSPREELDNISIEHNVGLELGRACMKEGCFTALMAVNDMVAYGVLSALAEAGKKVPDDYSVCGFDNIFPSQFLPVGLTTVEHHLVEKGRKAVEILHNKILGTNHTPCVTRIEYGHRLILRDSTGPVKFSDIKEPANENRSN